jgi:hypothetical protein
MYLYRNTFPAGKETFIPKVSFTANRFDFPACHIDKSVYRTVKVNNYGDTSVKFAFEQKEDAVFSVSPRIGILHKNESKLLVLRFSPAEQKLYQESLKCCFNSTDSSAEDLIMHGQGYFSQLYFENNLVFRPTCVGTVAARSVQMRNTSKIDLHYKAKMTNSVANSRAVFSGYLHHPSVWISGAKRCN